MDLVAVVREDDVDEVLADVVDVALHGAEHDHSLAAGVGLLHVRLEVGDRLLHHLGALEHERQLHLAGREAVADDLHALEEHVVDDRQGGSATLERLVEFALETLAFAVDDASLEALLHRPARTVLLLDRAGDHVLEEGHELGEGVVAVGAPIPDEIERDLLGPVVDAVHRHDAGRVHDGRVEADLAALVEEHAVEHVARRGLEAEGHVREPEHGGRAGELGLDAADRLDRLDGVAPEVLGARAEREGERVEEQVGGRDAVPLGGEVVDAAADPHLPLHVAGLALLVDREADHRRAVLCGEAEHPVESAALVLALLEVRGVEDGLAAEELEAGLHHLGLGGVEHEGECGLRGEAARDLAHVLDAVATDVVDADVEHVGALAHLLPGHLHAGVPVGLEHGLTELLGTVGVGALADGQVGEVLMEGHVRVDRRAPRFGFGGARHRCPARSEAFDDGAQVRRGGAAAAADDVEEAALGEVLHQPGGDVRRLVEAGVAHGVGQSGVGIAKIGRAHV